MRLSFTVFAFLITSIIFSQENTASLNFESGIEIAHYNYLNESLSISDMENKYFWDGYEEMKHSEAKIKASQQTLKKSLIYGFMKSDEEIISIVKQNLLKLMVFYFVLLSFYVLLLVNIQMKDHKCIG